MIGIGGALLVVHSCLSKCRLSLSTRKKCEGHLRIFHHDVSISWKKGHATFDTYGKEIWLLEKTFARPVWWWSLSCPFPVLCPTKKRDTQNIRVARSEYRVLDCNFEIFSSVLTCFFSALKNSRIRNVAAFGAYPLTSILKQALFHASEFGYNLHHVARNEGCSSLRYRSEWWWVLEATIKVRSSDGTNFISFL